MSLSDILLKRERLQADIDNIEREMKKRVAPIAGQTWASLDEWRQRAKSAREVKQAQIQVIDRYIEENQDGLNREDKSAFKCDIFKEALDLLKTLEREGVEFRTDEREIVRRLERAVAN